MAVLWDRVQRIYKATMAVLHAIRTAYALWKLVTSGVLVLLAILLADQFQTRWKGLSRGTQDCAYIAATLVGMLLIQLAYRYGYEEWWLGRGRERAQAAALTAAVKESVARSQRESEARRVAQEATRAAEAARYHQQIEGLRRACITAVETAERVARFPDRGLGDLEEAAASLRIERDDIGQARLGPLYERIGRLVGCLQGVVSVRFLGPNVASNLDRARTEKEEIVRELNDWLERSHG